MVSPKVHKLVDTFENQWNSHDKKTEEMGIPNFNKVAIFILKIQDENIALNFKVVEMLGVITWMIKLASC